MKSKLDGPENEKRAETFKQRLEEHDAEAAAQRKVFNPKEILANAKEIRSVYDEQLGEVRYGLLTLKEFQSLGDEADVNKKAYRLIHAMLKKAYPDLTIDNVESMPFEVVARLSTVLGGVVQSFLPRQKVSLPANLPPSS